MGFLSGGLYHANFKPIKNPIIYIINFIVLFRNQFNTIENIVGFTVSQITSLELSHINKAIRLNS